MEALTQTEIDLLIGKSWPEIVAVRQQVAKLDDRRDELNHINEEYEEGNTVGIFLFDQTGNIFFKHRVNGPCQFFERILTQCAGQLMAERAALFSAGAASQEVKPRPAVNQAIPDNTEWLTGSQLADRAQIVIAYVSAWAKNNRFHKKRDGKRTLYGVPDGFEFKARQPVIAI